MSINFIGSIIKKVFGYKIYLKIKSIYKILFENDWIVQLIIKNYDTTQDLNHNISTLKKNNCDIELIKKKFSNFNFNFNSEKISWHYHFFSGFKKDKLDILEIGTHQGNFTNFCAICNSTSKITTIDAPTSDESFLNAYDKDPLIIKSHIENRTKNLLLNNINFIELNSFYLLNKFNKNSFDLIWVDGDHLNPQVTFDIFSSLHLIKNDGYILVDDIVKETFKNKQVSNESYKVIENLKQKKIIEVDYLVKRVSKYNKVQKKLIALIKKINAIF